MLMKIINLIEDTPSGNGCSCEHGLSFYIETQDHKMIVDVGATGLFIENARKKGINLKKVDTVIISHGHYDHGGGLSAFVEINKDAKIYINENAFQPYYHDIYMQHKYIGLEDELSTLSQIVKVGDYLKIDEELTLFSGVKGRRYWPDGNKELVIERDGQVQQDQFEHEQYLVISYENKKILMSGCAHDGILNILDSYRELFGAEPDVVISGFHMQKKRYQASDWKMIEYTAEELSKLRIRFFTGHCTGEEPFRVMQQIMMGQIRYIRCGEEFIV